jgi:hypothetical protein
MSITQEYAEIRHRIGEKKFQQIEAFLTRHPDLFLSDVYYKPEVWAQMESEG